ncbi:26S proteasome non-ATPase regulatory subunit 10-like isoform X2 [Hetaerina americana]|uniref:26S proteasome non-ATPase regulatory subunit 10-like isoform X2 n=1 Tax=Hetaerina americana TaxID=62018 RepID=UPI003A7F3635
MASKNHDTVHDLAYLGNIGILKFKISQDQANANKRDGNERMLIHWAALGGHPEIVEYLLELGSPVDPLDDNGATPLLLASSAGKVAVVRILLSRGANPSASNSGKHSALQYASSKGWLEIVDLLLNQGADANARDERGATPLHRAASKGIISVMESLVLKGDANINVADSYGNTPLEADAPAASKSPLGQEIEGGDRVQAAVVLIRVTFPKPSVNPDFSRKGMEI